MGGNATISNSTPMIGAVRIQQSTYGLTIPLVWGRPRITGNLIWYGDFKATPHTEVTQSGGKGGGGVSQSSTTYTYSAAVMMALCWGPILGIRTVWRGKGVYVGSTYSGTTVKVSEQLTVGAGGAVTVANTNGWANVSAELILGADTQEDFRYYRKSARMALSSGVDYTASAGTYTFSGGRVSPGDAVLITYTYTSTASGVSCLSQIGLDLMKGHPGQAPWSYLTTNHPSQAVGYSSIAYVTGASYLLTGNAEVENHAFEIEGPLQFSSTIPDANPAPVVVDALTNPIYGAGFGAQMLGPTADFMNACTAQGIFLSPALTEQMTAAQFLDAMAKLCNVGLVWSNGVLKFVPYTDVPVTGNGVTFTPNTAPVYDLTDDDFLPIDDDGPIKVKIGAKSDTFNSVRLEYLDRANGYNIAIMPAEDGADILEFGLRTMPTIQAHWICDAGVAKIVATLILQRSMFVRNTYEYKLGWTKIGLEPMDLVTLTDPGLGLSKQPVRIVSMDESDDGELDIVAEDFPKGSASATLYPATSGAGFSHNYNASPGNALAPVIFEAPVALSSSNDSLEVWLATGGTDPNYGGCEVWVSLTGSNFQRAAVLTGSSRFGVSTTALAADTAPGVSAKSVGVSLAAGGQLLSAAATDRDQLATLCYLGGEFLSYDNVTLNGAGAYTVGPSLNRGAYGSGQGARASGVPFVRCDAGVAKMPLTKDYIGKTLHIKLLAFNLYSANTQDLASVAEYTYTVTGAQANMAPAAPTGLALEGAFTISTAKFKWDKVGNADTYTVQVWAGSPLAKVREVNVGRALRFDYSAADARADGGPWRALELRVQGINANGAPGAFAVLDVSNPQIGALSGAAVVGSAGAIHFSCTRPGDSDFSGIRIWASNTSGFTPGTANLVYDGPNTSVVIRQLNGGAALVNGTPYYVRAAAYDSFDQLGLVMTSEMSVTPATDLRTMNYAEDGSGNPTAGASMSSSGTAMKAASGSLQLGSVVFTDYWQRLVQGIDGAVNKPLIWRGNNDTTTRGGAPNISCLTVYAMAEQVVTGNFQQAYWTYMVKPTSYSAFSDNLDSILSLRVRLYQSTSSSAPFQDIQFPCVSRSYNGTDGAAYGSFHWGWRSPSCPILESSTMYSGYMRVNLINAYGSSADSDFGPTSTVGAALPAATITGQAAGTGGGAGGSGGACPAPWVKVTLANGTQVHAGDLHNGARVAAVNDSTLEIIPAGGVIREFARIWKPRYRVKLADGRASEFSERHRLAVVGLGWVSVEHIRPGFQIVGMQESIVESVLAVGEGLVISFRVEGAGTYFADGLLCHNQKMLP